MKNQLPLISTRLKMPQPRKNYIRRETLFSKLERMNQYAVILVKGGAGTGKTTLITSYAKEVGISDLKWLSLDESCDHVFMFWSYFIEAVSQYLGATREEFISWYGENFQKNKVEQLLTLLINQLKIESDLYIVLDDFHHVTDGFLIRTLDFFIKNMPEQLHLILLTRHDPLLYLGALQMEGRLLVLDEHDLKLSPEAGMRFLVDTLGLPFRQETLQWMNEISEGWIGGLQLIAAAAASKSEAELKRFNFETKLVGDYLTKEMFEILSETEKEFLVTTSILTYFNEEICEGLLEKIEFQHMMEGLIQKNILITCIDEEQGVYRYHNILREYLIGRFARLPKEIQIQLHIKAAKILKELGDSSQSIDHFLRAEDYSSAMKYILEHAQNMALFSYVDRIPESYITQNPDFAYQSLFYHYANMEFEKCQRLYEVIEKKMAEEPTFLAFRFSNLFVEEHFKINELNIMPISEIEPLPLKETTKALILIRDAAFLHTLCRYDEALTFIERAMEYEGRERNFYIAFFSFSIKSQILEDMGELRKCEALYKEMKTILATNQYTSMFNTSFFIGYTGLHLKQMNLEAAANCLSKAEEYIDDTPSPSVIGYQYNLAEYKFIRGETGEALELVRELLQMQTFENIVLMNTLLSYVFQVNNYTGELVQQFVIDYERIGEGYKSLDSQLIYAKLLFHKGERLEALERMDQILKYSRSRKIKLMLVKAALAKLGMLMELSSKKREMLNLFREALFYSSEDKILLPFYFERERVVKAIREFGSSFYAELNYTEKAFYQEILRLCQRETKPILSEREMDVLKEMAKGASNKEIAEQLYISLATVKSHIINIYGKLQVKNRVAAIEKGRALGLL